ncbi:hypothetical protein JOM56_004879 [Amanita muscaria]
MFHRILQSKGSADITAWCFPVAVNGAKAEDMVERFITFGGVKECWSKTFDEPVTTSESEEILATKGISVAPPERLLGSLSQLPFAAPRVGISRERLDNEDDEEGEEDSGEDSEEEGEEGEEGEEDEVDEEQGNDSGGDDYEPPASGDSEGDENVQEGEGEEDNSAFAGEAGNVEKDDSALVAIQEVDNEMEGIEDAGQVESTDVGQVESSRDVLPPAEGSSRVIGGFSRGRALGNVLNFPDAPDLLVDGPFPAQGIVRVYSERSSMPSVHKPSMTMKAETKPTLGPILQKLGRKYSPVRKCRIFAHEDGNWNVKGLFQDALEEDEEITWTADNGQLCLSLCAEGRDASAVPTASQSSHAPGIGARVASDAPVSQVAVKSGDLSSSELIALLNVPEHLAQSIKNAGLRINYAKYKACLQAQETLSQKIKQGTWPTGIKKPTATNIIELFVSRTYWHHYVKPAFHDISHFEPLKQWLESTEGGPADAAVWGSEQTSYSFADLQKEKDRRQQLKTGKKKEGDNKGQTGKGKKNQVNKEGEEKKKGKKVLFRLFMAWIWIMVLTNLPLVAAASREQQPFPDVPFAVFSKFVEDHFISTVSLSTVLMVLFSVTENTDLLSLHYRQRCSERSTSATGWIRCFGSAVQKRLEEENESLLKESDVDAEGSVQKTNIAIGLKLDALARVVGLYPINKSGQFKGKLKAVSHKGVQPVYTLCPNTAICITKSCNKKALFQWTRARDVPLVRLIKDFKVHEQVQVYSGHCKGCKTLYYADHERAPYASIVGQHERVYLNSAKYIKIGQSLWVDRAFTAAVLSGMYTFHASAAAYTEFWNSAFDTDGRGMSRRQVWQAFVQESIRLVASSSNNHFAIQDGLPIDEVTKEAFTMLGENGILRSADQHECSECTHKYKRASDVIPDANGNVSDMVGMEERIIDVEGQAEAEQDVDEEDEAAQVKMVVVDGIVMGYTHCAFEGCTSDLGNARGGVYCPFHELAHGGKCHAANCAYPNVEGTLACEGHQAKWRRHQANHRNNVLGGYRRALRRPDETLPWMPAAPQPRQVQQAT